jgi:hypothetical protein
MDWLKTNKFKGFTIESTFLMVQYLVKSRLIGVEISPV